MVFPGTTVELAGTNVLWTQVEFASADGIELFYQVHDGKHGGHVAVRTIVGGAVTDDFPGLEDAWKILIAYTNGRVGLIIFQQYVVARFVFLYQIIL